MFRPERMTSTSVICLRRDIDTVLKGLHQFGEFHIEEAAQSETLNEYNQSIQKTEEALADVNGIIKKLVSEDPGLLGIFRTETPTITKVTAENWQTLSKSVNGEIAVLKEETDKLSAYLTELQEQAINLNHVQGMLSIMDNMGADLAAIEELQLIHIAIASVPRKNMPDLNRALAGFPIIFHRCYLTKETEFVCLALPSKYTSDVEKILKIHHSEIFQIPPDLPPNVGNAIEEVSKRLKENNIRTSEAEAALLKLCESNRTKLISLRETTENILALLQAKRKILQSGRLATIKGFVPKKQFRRFKEKIDSSMNGNVLVLENEVAPAEDPPTKISNNRFVKPFEEITRLYGLPHYEELDPTPFIAFTFPIIFGLMFGDVGHGLILLVGGLTFGLLIKKQSSIKNMSFILAACGLAAIVAGLLYGEFFGIQVFAPLWFSPFKDVLGFLIFSLFVGVAQILSGIVLELVNFALRRNFADVLLTSIPKIAFYVGSVYLIAVYQLNFGAWLSGPILFALVPFLVLALGKPIFYSAFREKSTKASGQSASFTERLFESGDLVTRLLSNTVSYTRILALLMAHWALILATYEVVGLIGSGSVLAITLGGFVVVVGNVFVIGLEGLIVFIHTVRLHFYEWFSKFYQGNGTTFAPFKQKFLYTEVTLGQKPTED